MKVEFAPGYAKKDHGYYGVFHNDKGSAVDVVAWQPYEAEDKGDVYQLSNGAKVNKAFCNVLEN